MSTELMVGVLLLVSSHLSQPVTTLIPVAHAQEVMQTTIDKNSQAQQVTSLVAAIKQVESGGNYQARGQSGEQGAYQIMPGTWHTWAKQYLGNAYAPMTKTNQDRVATKHVESLIQQGYSPFEVALIWNGGEPRIKKGMTASGVQYDSGAYARKIVALLPS